MSQPTWVRCHFAEEIDPAQWVPPADLLLPQMGEKKISAEPILTLQDLKKYYPVQGSSLRDVVGLYLSPPEADSNALSPNSRHARFVFM